MILVIKPKVILGNVFLGRQETYLETDVLRRFCDILHSRLVEQGYKYVILKATSEDITRFCDDDGRFVKGIGKIHCTEPVTEEYVNKANAGFSDDVKDVLQEVRSLFIST